MFKNTFLHHFISLIIFGVYYSTATYVSKLIPTPAEPTLYIPGLIGILLLFFVGPIILYTVGNWLLLPELGTKGKFKTLLWQNSIVFIVLYAIFFVWFVVGDSLKDPITITMIFIWLLYGLLMLAIIAVGVLLLQCLHAKHSWEKAINSFTKHWRYALYWLGGAVVVAFLWAYLPVLPPKFMEFSVFGIIILIVAAYTQWQQKLYSSLGLNKN